MIYRVTLACDIEAEDNADAIEQAAGLQLKSGAGITTEVEIVEIEDENWEAVT